MWDIGQKIVCVDDKFERRKYNHVEILPVKHKTYTIRDITFWSEDVAFLLEEITNRKRMYNDPSGSIVKSEVYFKSKRFKPIDQYINDIDISVFSKLLIGGKVPELV